MVFLDEVADFFAALSTDWTVATNVFKNRFPAESTNTAIALYETGGAPPLQEFAGSDVTYMRRPNLQVVSRSTAYATARANAEVVYNRLTPVSNSTLSGTTYVSIDPLQEPFDVGTDPEGRHLVSCNYTVWRRTT